MTNVTRDSILNEVHYLIQAVRLLKDQGEISPDELQTLNKHLGALKSVLRIQVQHAKYRYVNAKEASLSWPLGLRDGRS